MIMLENWKLLNNHWFKRDFPEILDYILCLLHYTELGSIIQWVPDFSNLLWEWKLGKFLLTSSFFSKEAKNCFEQSEGSKKIEFEKSGFFCKSLPFNNNKIFSYDILHSDFISRYLHFPQCLGACCRGGCLSCSSSQEDIGLLLVIVCSQEFLLLCMKQSHHITLERTKISQK